MNLLKELSNPLHPLNKAVTVANDNSIISSFNNRELVIYGEDRNCLEMLAREIVFATMLAEEKKYYQIEHTLDNNKRIDAIAEPDGQGIPTNIIEFKNFSANYIHSQQDLKQQLDIAKSQVLNFYLGNEKVNDCFVSIVITDVEKIITCPENYALYFETDEDKKAALFSSFQKYGICIKTYRYNKLRGELEDMGANHICSHAIFEVTTLTASKRNTLIPTELTTVTACRIENAVNIPTKGQNSVGVKNVRDIKSLEDSDKKKLVNSFMNDLLVDFVEDPSNYFAFFNKGKTKDFTYVLPKTMVFKAEKSSSFIVATLDGALIDGQNSVNTFKIILDMIDKKLRHPNDMSKAERSLYNRFEKMYVKLNPLNTMTINENIVTKFETFVKNQMIKFEIIEVDTKEKAIDYAIAKNNSIPVSKSELCHSKITDSIQLLGYQLAEAQIDLEFPKKNRALNMAINFTKISFEKVIKLLFTTLSNEEKRTGNLFHCSYKLNSSFNIGEFEAVKKCYLIKELSLTKDQTKELEDIDEEIRDLRKVIDGAKKIIEETKEEYNSGDLSQTGYNKRMNRQEAIIEDHKVRIKNLESSREAYVSFAFKDIKKIKNTVQFYLNLCEVLKQNKTKEDEQLISQYFNYENYWFDVIYVNIMKTHKNVMKMTDSDIVAIYRKMTDNFKSLSQNYAFGTTMIRNGNCAIIPSRDDTKPNISIEKFFEMLVA